MPISIFDLLMPHHCCSCGEIGEVLCEHCKYDITSEPFSCCMVCLKPTTPATQLCASCIQSYSKAWCAGERNDALKALINRYKYDSAMAATVPLAAILDAIIPQLPPNVRVVAVPTISRHIRARGYDHTAKLARRLSRRRHMMYDPVLERVDNSHQQGSTRCQRMEQAKRAFYCRGAAPVPYLLIDDVYTTGATVHYAAKALRDAGASDVYVAILARQPLEKG